jgi:phosphohistidine phosphatase
MKTLYITRHAKSSWENSELADHQRPLKNRGKNDAQIIGARLKEEDVCPDLIISSHANRAHSTAKIIASEIGYDPDKIQINKTLYFNGRGEIIDLINKTADDINELMIFGHNPDFTGLVNILANQNIFNLPTCGIACIEFEVDSWKQIEVGNGQLKFYYSPKMFKENL